MNSPKEIAENYVVAAKTKTSQIWYKTFVLAILAGAFIAFGGAVATVASAGSSGAQASLIKGAVFPVGLILVVICGGELFTGNCLLIAPLTTRDVKISGVLKCLGISYIGNLIGSVIVALLAVYGHIGTDASIAATVATAAAKCNVGFGYTVLKGIACNMLVCLAVWGAMASKNAVGKVLIVYMPIFAFVVCGFEHSVANMYYLSAGLMTGAEYGISSAGLNFGNALLYSLLPSTIGNVIGGALIAMA